MTDSGRVDAIRSAAAALNAGDVDGYLSYFAPSAMRWVSGFEQPLTLEEIGESIRQLFKAFDALHLDEDLLFGTERFVCARWRLRGVHEGEYLGTPPSHRTIDVQNCEVYEFDGERVIATWSYEDPGQIFRQIGAGSEDGGAR